MQIVVVLWNPPKKRLVGAKLEDKLRWLVDAVTVACKLIAEKGDVLGCFVAPDYLFEQSPEPYDEGDFEQYQKVMTGLAASVPKGLLIVAGSMQWVHGPALRVTCLYLNNGEVCRYDKKSFAGTERGIGKSTFKAGEISGLFAWRSGTETILCGIEICQDHEEKQLVKECGRPIDLQILLSYGQSCRAESLALKRSKSVFIQCELMDPNELNKSKPELNMVQHFNGVKCCSWSLRQLPNSKASRRDQDLRIVDGISSGELAVFMCDIELEQARRPSITLVSVSSSSNNAMPMPMSMLQPSALKPVQVQQQRPPWQPDSGVTRCFRCQKEYSFFRRKHHCRQCGLVVCGDCSQNEKHADLLPSQATVDNSGVLEGGMLRVCQPCFDTI